MQDAKHFPFKRGMARLPAGEAGAPKHRACVMRQQLCNFHYYGVKRQVAVIQEGRGAIRRAAPLENSGGETLSIVHECNEDNEAAF